MGKKILGVTLLLAVGAAVYFSSNCCSKKPCFKKYREDGWFGVKSLKAGEAIPKDSTEIRPFKVAVSDADLQDLKTRLSKSRYVDHIAGTQFTYGFNSEYLKKVVDYWLNKYNWREQEAKLNAYPQFKTQIEGLDIHFVHVKASPKAKTVIPLLMNHGWPGSFLENYKTFPLLSEPDANGIAYEIIAPSIPGYGYSEAAHQKGLNINAVARIFVKLMKRLGHEKFVVHGGDWGAGITKAIGIIYPENVIGVHIVGNFDGIAIDSPKKLLKTLAAAYFPGLFFPAETRERDYNKLFPFWSEKFIYLIAETGYMHIQGTKPDTVAAALVDSPVGLAAYILEKFSTWTNPAYRELDDGGLTKKFTLDEILTNVMIYWTSGNIASSMRFYRENLSEFDEVGMAKVTVPAATVDTPHEMVRTPRKLIEDGYDNLLQYSDFPDGGHFTAFELPKLVAADIQSFVKKVLDQQEQAKREQAKQKSSEL